MGKILETIKHYTNPYRLYYRLFYYFPFGIRRINNLKEVKIGKKKTIQCRLEVDNQEKKHHNFLFTKINPNPWFVVKVLFWLRVFAFQLPGCSIYFKAPRFTPWDYNSKTGEVRFGVNHTFLNRLKNEYGIEIKDIKFVTWRIRIRFR